MIFESRGICIIRSKQVVYTKDEPNENGEFCTPVSPLEPGDHHWVRLICPHWNSTRDWRQGKPPVLTVDHLFGMRLVLTHPHLLSVMVGVIARYYESGNRGPQHLDPRQFILPADSLGLLNHPHVIAISGLQSAVALCRYFDSTLAVTGPRQLEIAA